MHSAPLGRRALLTLPAGALGLAACTTGESVDLEDSGGSGIVPPFAAALGGVPDQLDPHKTSSYFSFQVLENIFDTLVEPDEELVFRGALAEDWTVSEDQLMWTFTLREGLTFHDGSPCTSEDVVYSYRRIIDEELTNAWRFAGIAEVRAPDERTVEITLEAPRPGLLSALGGFKGMSIVQRENVESGQILDRPLGTGPFRFDSYRTGSRLILLRHEEFWGGPPPLEGVTIRFLTEGNTAQTALQNDEVQWTDAFAPQQTRLLEGNASLEVAEVPSNDYWYITLNQANAPWDTVQARQAIAYAIDRDGILKVTQYGTGEVNQLAIPETSPWYVEFDEFGLDPDRSQELFDEVGYSGGRLHFLATNEYPETSTVAQLLADSLSPFGIELDIETVDFATWLDKQSSGEWDILMLGWLGSIDPNDFYYNQHHSDGASNHQGYSNPRVDELLDAGSTESDEDARYDLYAEAATIIATECSYIYLYNPAVRQAWQTTVTGYTARGDAAVRFRDTDWEGES